MDNLSLFVTFHIAKFGLMKIVCIYLKYNSPNVLHILKECKGIED